MSADLQGHVSTFPDPISVNYGGINVWQVTWCWFVLPSVGLGLGRNAFGLGLGLGLGLSFGFGLAFGLALGVSLGFHLGLKAC